jgi:hypothetical protein
MGKWAAQIEAYWNDNPAARPEGEVGLVFKEDAEAFKKDNPHFKYF